MQVTSVTPEMCRPAGIKWQIASEFHVSMLLHKQLCRTLTRIELCKQAQTDKQPQTLLRLD